MEVRFTTEGESLAGYFAKASGRTRGCIVLIHEIWGLQPHIREVADRFAAEGYSVLAPDLLSHNGVDVETGAELERLLYLASDAERTASQPRLRELFSTNHMPEYVRWATAALRSTVDRLLDSEPTRNTVAAVGFCFGGSFAFRLAAADSRVVLALPFYGTAPEPDDLQHIECKVEAFYGDEDVDLMLQLPALTDSMKRLGIDFVPHLYAGCGHAFFNDSNALTFAPSAAQDAWARSLEALSAAFP